MTSIVPNQAQRDLVRRYTEDHMHDSLRIHRGIRGGFDEVTGQHGGLAADSVVYEGKGRVRQITGAGVLSIGEADIDTATATISIPWGSASPRRDDLVELVANDSDPEPAGQFFRVLDIESGGLFGEARRMRCVVWRDSAAWERA